MEKLRSHLERGIMLFDGAMGTMLEASGALADVACPEELNVVAPEKVKTIHRAYIEAGAEAILTNTFGGNRVKLAKSGLGGRVRELNLAGSKLAREVAGEEMLVAGSMGPLGEFLAPLGNLSRQKAIGIFAEQAQALAEGGVDMIIVETMYDLAEIEAAAHAVRESTDRPLICTMAFDTNLHTIMGVTPSKAALRLAEAGAFALGANCGGCGLEGMAEILRQMREARPNAIFIVKPNAGSPQVVEGRVVYEATPQDLAEYAKRYVELGARMVGGCCGTTPAHIRAIAEALGKI